MTRASRKQLTALSGPRIVYANPCSGWGVWVGVAGQQKSCSVPDQTPEYESVEKTDPPLSCFGVGRPQGDFLLIFALGRTVSEINGSEAAMHFLWQISQFFATSGFAAELPFGLVLVQSLDVLKVSHRVYVDGSSSNRS